MTDTVRTVPELQTLLADSAAAHSTNRQLLRDMLVSLDYANQRTANILAPIVNAKNLGWVGDNVSRPLSGIYPSLAAAQAVYPHVTSLSQELDWAAAQAAINLFTSGRLATSNGEIWFSGIGLINTPLIYCGNPSYSLYLRGIAGQGAGSTGGACIRWVGTTGTSMIQFQGACRTTIDGVNIRGETGSGITNCIHVSADNVINTTLSGSITAGVGVVATPAAMTNIGIGTLLGIGAGSTFELVYVTAVGGSTFTANFLRDHAAGVQIGASAGSSGVRVKNLSMTIPAGATSCGVLVGNVSTGGTMQADLFRSEKNIYIGSGAAGSAYAGIRQITGGNVKNFYSLDDEFWGLQSPIAIEAGSGVYSIKNPEFLSTTVQDVLMLGTGHIIVDSSEAESATGHRFLKLGQGGSQSPISAVIQNNSWECSAPADDIVIDSACSLVLLGNNILNNRTGSSIPIIRNAELLGANSPASITSIGNFYQRADDTTPVFYQSANALKNGTYPSRNLFRLFSMNDYGGVAGALVPLTPLMGPVSMPIAGCYNDFLSAGITFNAIGRINRSINKVTIPFAAFSAAALTKDLDIMGVPQRSKIVGVYADTTTAFAGPAGTLNLRIGFTVGGQELILDHDVKSGLITAGLLDADLGASLSRAGAVQGGAHTTGTWAGTTQVKARLTSSSGNLSGLNAGSVTVYVEIERML